MSSVGILAWKSSLDEGRPYPVPDFRNEASRRQVENDHWSPWPQDTGPGQPPPSVRGFVQPTAESVAFGKEIWARQGYQAP
jgi:hypothetical protein